MARIARVVIPGIPHHITQRGNRRMQTFFCDDDYQEYMSMMSASCRRYEVDVWAYCLMPNHVHFIAVPKHSDSFRHAIGEAHRRYTRHVNFREKWKGHLWQERFASYPMSENHLLAAARYIELNPVRAGIAKEPWYYKWSSAGAHVRGCDDNLVHVLPLLEIVEDWRGFIGEDVSTEEMGRFRLHERTGRPLGDKAFLERVEGLVSRVLRRQKPGPKKKDMGS
ncbi:MAG: transposase [Deltaproteobacteria bacterium CG_4_9_14_3_um_filter_44_9]|nr:MAG: transposase [Deltaproteobacteria bacterium CG2_30_43_15]PIU84737.1 MAG: transposase [Deltaproteobacteria bacterium CG06_land_8_20_14_3_00_44_19]PIZ18529.1 MAG: transposase [Deltaproteobacteria bacterium CG_4_10_14_0_8_um_filter_43_12]PJB43188.1 MAG: transposase [Deltaproteobacteria bacterium CG_4_9_14_3_um_filter_44_9]